MRFVPLAFPVALAMSIAFGPPAQAAVLFTQAWDGTANMFSSQSDPGGSGAIGAVYDNFTLSTAASIHHVSFTGGFFNPAGGNGNITGFTVKFYADNAGQPGASVYSATIPGNGGETSLGSVNGFLMATYGFDLPVDFLANQGTQYWVSFVPDLAFPPQWGAASATGGDGVAYQDFLGSRGTIPDVAFSLEGTEGTGVPEPMTLSLLGSGLIGLGMARRRRRQ